MIHLFLWCPKPIIGRSRLVQVFTEMYSNKYIKFGTNANRNIFIILSHSARRKTSIHQTVGDVEDLHQSLAM